MISAPGRLVQYHDDGLRAGYLVEETEWERMNEVQIVTIEPTPRKIWVPREDVREVNP